MPFPLLRRAPRLVAGQQLTVAGQPVRLKVNARARRVSLRIDAKSREVVATAPSAKALAQAVAFAESRSVWIAAQLAALTAPVPFRPGAVIEVEGGPLRLERAAMRIRTRRVAATDDEPARLIASGDGEAFARAVERSLRAHSLERLSERTAVHCVALGVPCPPVAVMAARGRWGSCTPARAGAGARIRYNWRLILGPPEVLDYVAAHEVAHLVEANHGPRFWAVVERLYGEPRRARAWLRAEGGRLQAIGGYSSSGGGGGSLGGPPSAGARGGPPG